MNGWTYKTANIFVSKPFYTYYILSYDTNFESYANDLAAFKSSMNLIREHGHLLKRDSPSQCSACQFQLTVEDVLVALSDVECNSH